MVMVATMITVTFVMTIKTMDIHNHMMISMMNRMAMT